MPLITPCRSWLRSSSNTSSPLPNSAVRISRAEGRGAGGRRRAQWGQEGGARARAVRDVGLAVELDAGRGEEVPAEPGHRHVIVPEHALVGEVVDGEQAGPGAPDPGGRGAGAQ